MRINYWSCSSFADWLRGTDKLKAGTSKEWAQWKRASKEAHPIRYWIVEEGLDYVQDALMWVPDKLNDIRYYINNRWVTKSHCLTAHPRDIKPGQWQDVGNRFLPCLFNELVDFVEIEQAWHHCIWSDEEQKKYSVPWWRKGWLRWRVWRCPEAGLEYLRWAAGLTMDESMGLAPEDKGYGEPTYQAKAAKEIIELYTWWTEIRPKRPDTYEESGWHAVCEQRRRDYPDEFLPEERTKKEKAETQKALDKLNKLELQYEAEDEAMMIRLIKIRQSLWT